MKTDYFQKWNDASGINWTDRNNLSPEQMDEQYKINFAMTRTGLNDSFIGNLSRSSHILEVGCNSGNQLHMLHNMGFKNLNGVEIQKYAVELAKSRLPEASFSVSSATNLPYSNNQFDLVFTSGALMCFDYQELKIAMKEIYRCSKKYIWGFEYTSKQHKQISCHNGENLYWLNDFSKIYLENFSKLRIVKQMDIKAYERFSVIKSLLRNIGIKKYALEGIYKMFLLEKISY